ncbi:MAG: DNA repair protein RecO [Gammaproteobacteria bacterium]|nr:DNA repair protein RecO [Gammaproteobacteria bacterium]
MENRIYLQPAYMLHSMPFRNTSLLVDFFTLDYGLVRTVARGARREKSRYRFHLQLFQPVLISLAGRSELRNLTAVECNTIPIHLQGRRLFSGLYVNELLTRLLLNQEEHKELYLAYQDALLALQGKEEIEFVLRRFELRLLKELGYAFNLEHDCISQQPIEADQLYRFRPEMGFEPVPSAATVAEPTDIYPGAHLLALRAGEFQETETAKTAKRLLRQALKVHLGNRPLYSRTLFS